MVIGFVAVAAIGAEMPFAANFQGKELPVEECRVSAIPFNRVWPGTQRPIEQSKIGYFTSFDVDAPGEFTLRLPDAAAPVRVHPFRRGGWTVKNGVFRMRIEKPEQFVVVTAGREFHVFADAPWKYVPRPGDRYFGPGIHEPGAIIPKSGERIVLDRGATVYGNFVFLGVTNVTVEGRGILDGSRIAREDPKWPGTVAAAKSGLPGVSPVWGTTSVYAYKCGGLSLSGIVFRDPSRWTMNICDSSDILIDGVKLVGLWRYNADGIDLCACQRAVVRNSFVRSFDDCMIVRPQLHMEEATETRDISVSNCFFWCDWGAVMKVQHGQRACGISDVRFRDIDCARVDWTVLTVTTRWGSEKNVIRGVSFEDIRADIADDRVAQQYQERDDMKFVSRPSRRLCLVDVSAYSMGKPAPNQGKPGKMDPSFFHLDYSDLVFRNFKVYDRPGHLLDASSDVDTALHIRNDLPHFKLRNVDIADFPKIKNANISKGIKIKGL